jgi:hypothetical protein
MLRWCACIHPEAPVHLAFSWLARQWGMNAWCRHPWGKPSWALAVLATLAVLSCPATAGAGEHGDGDREEHDHDRARRAVQAGNILPLQEVLARLARRQSGQVLEVELERESGRWVY